jgi:hypothetical protein
MAMLKPLTEEQLLAAWDKFERSGWVQVLDPAKTIMELVSAGDPDGPLAPLPVKRPAERVVPAFPLTAYCAMVAGERYR